MWVGPSPVAKIVELFNKLSDDEKKLEESE